MTLPESVPLITLGQCNLFPHGLLPLYIFEPQYREMVGYALEHSRIMCVSTRLPAGDQDDDDAVFPYSTAGLIRACVRGEDGTSNLILQGLQRVRFGDWVQKEPFRIVNIEPIPSLNPQPERAVDLQRRLKDAIAKSNIGNAQMLQQLDETASPEVLVDVVGYHLIPDPYARQPLLEMDDVCDRLEFLLRAFASV
ncbi:MAG: LON peptidase substrate-binding domain-containing protein [Verrucomicrobia bacterium]|nr:LON peptidase substrate-binding domain-containing protein [Verrucomicrobiota bacterium]